ncbi:MAG: HD domain-containing phosphohydrolase, partial [Pseudomonadota bacterium]
RPRTMERVQERSGGEALLKSLYESSSILMGIVDLMLDDRIIHVYDNPATIDFFSVEDTAERSAESLGAPDVAIREWVRHYRTAERERRPVHFEYEHPAPQGPLWLSATVALIGRSGPERTRFSYIAENITKRKRAEEALSRSENDLRDSFKNMRRTLGAVVQTIALMIESRDPYTAGHQRRVSDLARAIGDEMQLTKKTVEGLRMAGVIHDLGKIHIPAEILSKPGKLTSIEVEIVHNHSQAGFDILSPIDFPWPIAEIVLQHHERLDGGGYPHGLMDDEILPEARILAVADVVEAIASHRPYRPSLGIGAAMYEIEKGRGTRYDADAVGACLRLFRENDHRLRRDA